MAAGNARDKPPAAGETPDAALEADEQSERYRRLPTGSHGLDPELVKRDQRQRLQQAMVELIAEKGYPAVRIVDLARLAHVSQPTFYGLFVDKEDLFLGTYDEVAGRAARAVLAGFTDGSSDKERLLNAMRAWTALAATDPQAVSLIVLGAFGAGARALRQRRATLERAERGIRASWGQPPALADTDLTIKAVLGGIREVTATRLRDGREHELPDLAAQLADWTARYPRRLPPGLDAPSVNGRGPVPSSSPLASERARRAEGRLPSGRSDLPRQFIVNSQRERIVDATAAIVAEDGLAALTIPKIARRANVSHQTFYDNYASKHDAFLGAQKVGLHVALRVAAHAYDEHAEDWPTALAAGIRALVHYLVSEPAHAHLTLVDTFGASPQALEIRNEGMIAFSSYLAPGYAYTYGSPAPAVAAEAVAGGVWQILHHYIENHRIDELCAAVPQMIYFALNPFFGPTKAADYATRESA